MTFRLDRDRSRHTVPAGTRGWAVRACAVALGLAGSVALQFAGQDDPAPDAAQACIDPQASAPVRTSVAI